MFAIFSQAKELFDKRFLLNALLPSILFWGLLVALYVTEGHPTVASLARFYRAYPADEQALVGGTFIISVTVFAVWLNASTGAIVRVFEGSWPRFLQSWGRATYASRMQELTARNEEAELFSSYPSSPADVRPTVLGNILLSAQEHPLNNYNINATVIWPRLYHLLPEAFRASFIAAKSTMEFFIIVSALASGYGVLSGIYLISCKGDYAVFQFSVGGAWLIAFLTYRGAVSTARTYGQHIRAAFDLYRNLLLKETRLALPADSREEHVRWESLSQFFFRAVPLQVYCETRPAPSTIPSPAPDLNPSSYASIWGLIKACLKVLATLFRFQEGPPKPDKQTVPVNGGQAPALLAQPQSGSLIRWISPGLVCFTLVVLALTVAPEIVGKPTQKVKVLAVDVPPFTRLRPSFFREEAVEASVAESTSSVTADLYATIQLERNKPILKDLRLFPWPKGDWVPVATVADPLGVTRSTGDLLSIVATKGMAKPIECVVLDVIKPAKEKVGPILVIAVAPDEQVSAASIVQSGAWMLVARRLTPKSG